MNCLSVRMRERNQCNNVYTYLFTKLMYILKLRKVNLALLRKIGKMKSAFPLPGKIGRIKRQPNHLFCFKLLSEKLKWSRMLPNSSLLWFSLVSMRRVNETLTRVLRYKVRRYDTRTKIKASSMTGNHGDVWRVATLYHGQYGHWNEAQTWHACRWNNVYVV